MAHKRGSVADRMAFFRRAIEEEKKMNSRAHRTRPMSADVSSWRTESAKFSNNNVLSSYSKPRWQRSASSPKGEDEQSEKSLEGASIPEQPEVDGGAGSRTEKDVTSKYSGRRPVSADFSNINVLSSYSKPRWQRPTPSPKEEEELREKSLEVVPTPEQMEPENRQRKTEKVVSQRKEPRVLKKKPELKRQMSVSAVVLTWCQDVTKGYKGVDIKNFSGSFANGLALCALIHKFNPDKFDYDVLEPENREYNVRLALQTGLDVGIPALLTADEFLRMKRPEPRSVQCYVQMIFSKYKPKDLDMSNLRIA